MEPEDLKESQTELVKKGDTTADTGNAYQLRRTLLTWMQWPKKGLSMHQWHGEWAEGKGLCVPVGGGQTRAGGITGDSHAIGASEEGYRALQMSRVQTVCRGKQLTSHQSRVAENNRTVCGHLWASRENTTIDHNCGPYWSRTSEGAPRWLRLLGV